MRAAWRLDVKERRATQREAFAVGKSPRIESNEKRSGAKRGGKKKRKIGGEMAFEFL